MGMAMLVLVGQFVPAFVAFDLVLRYVPVESAGLPVRLRRWAMGFGVVALMWSALGGWGQYRLVGPLGLALGLLNLVPWWIIWRFGLRKQFTHLYKSDGGRPVVGAKRPGR